MYHAIVEQIARQNVLRVNRADYVAILKGFTPDIHRLGGDHALGGERMTAKLWRAGSAVWEWIRPA